MAQKATLVTATNINTLKRDYSDETTTGVELAIGYYLVVNFGDHFGYELLSAANFFAKYTKGETLNNPMWFEAVLKNPQGGA